MSKITFSIIGGSGFRAQYFFRIAKALPSLFRVSGTVVRDSQKAVDIEKKWKVHTYPTLKELFNHEKPDFVVVAVGKASCRDFLIQLAEYNVPILSETPPANDVDSLLYLHQHLTKNKVRIQIAEQYAFHPIQQARLSIIDSGNIGKVSEATVSISHLYHGASLIRKMLGVGFEEATIQGKRFETKLVAGPNRNGYPTEEKLVSVSRDLAWLDFEGKLGIYDFTKDQHRSWIRSNHLSVKGERGEIFDNHINYLADYQTPIHLDLKRINKGENENQEGQFLFGILAGNKWVYRNPYIPARLYDDELAIAHCLEKMYNFVNGGPSFYSLQEACQDTYLGLLIEEAIRTGDTVKASKQPWAEL